jgi:nucleoside phosphorylase
MATYPTTLVEAVASGSIVPFVGAGISTAVLRNSGEQFVPDWTNLLRHAVDRLEQEMRSKDAQRLRRLMVGDYNYGQVFSAAREIFGSLWEKFLQEELNPPLAKARRDTFELPRAVWRLSNNFIVTTNYDQVLEWASPAPNEVKQASALSVANAVPKLGERLPYPLLWHVYGTLQEGNAIFTFDGRRAVYNDVAGPARLELAEKALQNLFSGDYSVIFVGTSAPLTLSNQCFSASKRLHYWLVQEKDILALRKHLDVRGVPVQAIGFPSLDALPSFIVELANHRGFGSGNLTGGDPSPEPVAIPATTMSDPPSSVVASPTGTRRVLSTDRPTLAIFVALDIEREILVKHLGLKNQFPSDIWDGECNGLRVALFSSSDMGRVAGAIQTMRFLAKHRPEMLLVAGIAGGFKQEKVNLGDVIVAKSVADLASRKIRENKTHALPEFRPKEFMTDQRLPEFLQSGSFDRASWEQRIIEHGEWPNGLRPTLHIGTIASLDEVVGSAKWITKLLGAWPKLLGVEMESGGVCAAAEEYRIRAAVVRGVSDFADPAKSDDSWRRRSMKAVACTIDSLLDNPVVFAMPA